MGRKTEESLIDALSYCDLRDLPEIEDGENVWIRAIAKIAKSDGIEYYAYVEKDKNLNNRIVKDFGSMSSIVKVLEYYPAQQYYPDIYLQHYHRILFWHTSHCLLRLLLSD